MATLSFLSEEWLTNLADGQPASPNSPAWMGWCDLW